MMVSHKMNLFVSDFVKQLNLKSINIVTVVFASNAGFVHVHIRADMKWGVWKLKGVLCGYK